MQVDVAIECKRDIEGRALWILERHKEELITKIKHAVEKILDEYKAPTLPIKVTMDIDVER